MTSESDELKTNDFQRRRKLRIQQVREQSKDIAKKLRQRTKCEKLQHIGDLDARKEKQYLEHQQKLIKRLEQLYSQGLKSVGSSHHQATEITKAKLDANDAYDLAKLRGKEAAIELKRKKQALLDQQKKLLDRKVLAREAANVISREKSSTVAKKLQEKPSGHSEVADQDTGNILPEKEKADGAYEISKNDMATQWECAEVSNEQEHNVPALVLPKDDKEIERNISESKPDKSRQLDLFALSAEMPSSLRGGVSITGERRSTLRPTLNLVSEYLQNRVLRLREVDNPRNNKKSNSDLHSLKQTILRSRSSRVEGSTLTCCVLDDQIIPVPSWHAESNCKFCNFSKATLKRDQYHGSATSEANENCRPIIYVDTSLQPTPTLRDSSPFKRNKDYKNSAKENENTLSSGAESNLPRKNCVMQYSHSTRNVKDVLCNDTNLVVKDSQLEEDAYSHAFRQSLNENTNEEHFKKLQEMRSKVAMTKQSVEKEYNETMSILKKLPKEKLSKNLKTSYMDERRQNIQKDIHQQKLQNEFRKIEKEHKKDCKKRILQSQQISQNVVEGDRFEESHTQYSWMPVPEGDGNMAIHTIPTTSKDGKAANTVKFCQPESYHEYRSKHKHTPPTKDVNINKKNIETVLIQNDVSDTNNDSTSSLDTSSVENLNLETTEREPSKNLTETDKIIIYKILKPRMDKKDKDRKKLKLIDEVARVLNLMNEEKSQNITSKNTQLDESKTAINKATNATSVGEISEGIYEVVSQKGENITALLPGKRDNKHGTNSLEEKEHSKSCLCKKKISAHDAIRHVNNQLSSDDKSLTWANNESCRKGCANNSKSTESAVSTNREPSTCTSNSSFKTAVTVENSIGNQPRVKLLTDDNQDAGKLYIGASGFLKNEAYEVVIQLRKKDYVNVDSKESVSKSTGNIVTENKTINNPDTHIANSSPKASCDILVDKASNEEDTSKPDSGVMCSETSKRVSSQDLSYLQTDDNAMGYRNEKVISNQTDFKADVTKITPKEMSDKDVHTTAQKSFIISENFTKTEPIVRPTISTYTQTTNINSPILRPDFHISSSTSTAYLSPPDTLLPNYLKEYCLKFSDDKDTVETSQDELIETTEPTTENMYEHCTFKGYKQYKQSLGNRENTRPMSKKSFCTHNCHRENGSRHVSQKRNKRCHKHESHASSITVSNRHNNKNHSNKNLHSHRHISSSAPKLHKVNSTNRIKSKLNPVVKNYIQKLLELNNKGLEAIKIANLECSTVSTPNSSVVNVPHNIGKSKTNVSAQISLEQLRNILKNQIISENNKVDMRNSKHCVYKSPKTKRSVHKVKSLNISKKLIKSKKNKAYFSRAAEDNNICSPSSCRYSNKKEPFFCGKWHNHCKSLPSRNSPVDTSLKFSDDNCTSDTCYIQNEFNNNDQLSSKYNNFMERNNTSYKNVPERTPRVLPLNKAKLTCLESEKEKLLRDNPVETSTQTISQDIDSEVNLFKLAEGKIQNMEKIADLTEKCTKRLSNLAKVLDKVRRNKSLAYSHISTSDTASESEQKSDKCVNKEMHHHIYNKSTQKTEEIISPLILNSKTPLVSEYVPFLKDIPKPEELRYSTGQSKNNNINIDLQHTPKSRAKPPPALSRINLKDGQDVVPHELSTVVEVDSPMSMKFKNQPSRSSISENVTNIQSNNESIDDLNLKKDHYRPDINPDLLQSNKTQANNFNNNSKMKMMDIKQFNEVMLKPFISLQEYAKQSDGILEEGSNFEDNNNRNDKGNEDLSSLHSDGSLPDVISELLKRNIITEPFKFDNISNVNSTTLSSESTMSVLALSKIRNTKKKPGVTFNNKENISETSDSLSLSSNPDLENAFKKLGMGWASSTLKKTKERLALSSSSNTSSSSLSHFRIKTVNESDNMQELVTDSMSSVTKSFKRSKRKEKLCDVSKNAEQQTSLVNSMTVKEFLTNELANKITFTNRSNKSETHEEFVSLLETKLNDEIKCTTFIDNENTADSLPSGNNNRARTSTPVQIFKSLTYQSSSSSNSSKGLFSNADDLSSVKATSNSLRNHSTSDKDDLTVPNCSLKVRKNTMDCSKSD